MRKWHKKMSYKLSYYKWGELVDELYKIIKEIKDPVINPLEKKRLKIIDKLAEIADKYPEFIDNAPNKKRLERRPSMR